MLFILLSVLDGLPLHVAVGARRSSLLVLSVLTGLPPQVCSLRVYKESNQI